ncbi:MAG: tRNA-dihydrouridine synthase family protein [Bacteroidales bacterium]|nr:tRNA-dihydrouridine synthase family protein [Bacteroidales bacterium]
MVKIYSSPLQGYTDFRFRNAFQKNFGGIDSYMAPYIRLNGKKEIKAANKRDLLPANNDSLDLIPQVITKDADEFILVAKYVQGLGYNELNWNLGCPYPMVAKKGMGSGLLKNTGTIDKVLKQVFAESEIKISVKMRLGYERTDEFIQVLPILDKYPLENISIHPRIGKQLYKGGVYLDEFARCMDLSNHTLIYNGDITSVQRFREVQDQFPEIENWMIGRGLIADPFLPAMIKADKLDYPDNRIEVFRQFHDTLLASYIEAFSGSKHVLQKMFYFWGYFVRSFPNAGKGLKMIKKAQNIDSYKKHVSSILDSA